MQLDAITTATLSAALDAASLRQQAIAANIAHHATPGYVPQKVDFAAHMRDVQRQLAAGFADPRAAGEAPLRPQPKLDPRGQPAPVHLDAEMADLAHNAVHFQVLLRALKSHLAILSSAAADGRR